MKVMPLWLNFVLFYPPQPAAKMTMYVIFSNTTRLSQLVRGRVEKHGSRFGAMPVADGWVDSSTTLSSLAFSITDHNIPLFFNFLNSMKPSPDKLIQFAQKKLSPRASDPKKLHDPKEASDLLRASAALLLCRIHPDIRKLSKSLNNPNFRRQCKTMIRWSCKHVAEKYSSKGPLPIDDVLTAAAYITLLQLVEEVGTL